MTLRDHPLRGSYDRMNIFDFVRENKITMKSIYLGEGKEDKWDFYEWKCELNYGERTYQTSYKLGVGWRRDFFERGETNSYARKLGTRVVIQRGGKWIVPTPPKITDLLTSLQMDASSGEYLLFQDFCDDFGYDSDSIKAHSVWRACQVVRGSLMKLFREKFEEFMECEEW